jgi:serine/threonine protein phosphatase PrpC
MNYLVAAQTDVGTTKNINQDCFCLKVAQTKQHGDILFAIVCDGMGGLQNGEKASATVMNGFVEWFEISFPNYIDKVEVNFDFIKSEWERLIIRLNRKIGDFGVANNIALGTTIVATLCYKDKLYIANVGDSRIYKITDKVYRLTTDHSLVAQEIAAGNLSPDEEETDTRRNVLLQCVGASQQLTPEIKEYPLEKNATYLLCSDGFRHEIKEDELLGLISPNVIKSEMYLNSTLLDIIKLLKERDEKDNITAVSFKTV